MIELGFVTVNYVLRLGYDSVASKIPLPCLSMVGISRSMKQAE